MTLQEKSKGIHFDSELDLDSADAIIFDCDGVLIDVTKSYDLAIDKTTSHILKKYYDIESINISPEIIEGFKATGGFNDEVDLTYAAILSIYAADKLNKNQNDFMTDVINHADSTGIQSVEKYLESLADISDIKQKLDYPGPHHKNPLYIAFDQIFYGPILYHKLFKQPSEFIEPGFIENDIVIVSDKLLTKLEKKFGKKIAIVTGRGLESIRYSMKNLLDRFDVKSSAFLEDEARELAKPNPEALIRTIENLDSSHTIYVGDSMEDLLMAAKATEMGHTTTFCGITGTASNPSEKLKLFESSGSKLVLDSIDQLPKVLNLE
ncbi:MAG: HAD-IA family hydrolase [Nitrosopumilaceae archaeon]|nr:HAD-IA family hydrolase [candidate division KSB1 bacterium]NIU00693.1 HAD-IA family hydrolase [Nitrosopumilaceae archaeon]NIU87065.1 HAD-IA family hydrolase [Nitrosopumilaceae archaeon]NIV65634.1 HAD-IA family hydrolase [Nitrosopumilaceae archaeon]NIX61295.1 HAD-IA family hydrolase [Nitrosopumilaceae archaeon]